MRGRIQKIARTHKPCTILSWIYFLRWAMSFLSHMRKKWVFYVLLFLLYFVHAFLVEQFFIARDAANAAKLAAGLL